MHSLNCLWSLNRHFPGSIFPLINLLRQTKRPDLGSCRYGQASSRGCVCIHESMQCVCIHESMRVGFPDLVIPRVSVSTRSVCRHKVCFTSITPRLVWAGVSNRYSHNSPETTPRLQSLMACLDSSVPLKPVLYLCAAMMANAIRRS